ncbi:MAG: orotidine-5'-phosphate decarboxylase [Desulfonatronovibrio sp.]
MTDIIIALDFSDPEEALNLARTLKKETAWVKVGLELFARSGPEMVTRLKAMDLSVFLDLKLMDIPNTVSGSVSGCVAAGADMITLHTLGGKKMIQAALAARDRAGRQNNKPKLVGVTLLTSMDKEDLPWSDSRTTGEIVLDLAGKAMKWGLDGCVCSGLEARMIRENTADDFCLITPGIRTETSGDDQKRIVTPDQASKAGADFLVIGRPVTRSPDPVQSLRDIRNLLA